jgi:hypothetical protein
MQKKQWAISLLIALVLTLGLAPIVHAAPPTSVLLARVDINTDTTTHTVTTTLLAGTIGSLSSFNPEQPGNWGDEYGGGAVTAFPGDGDNAGYISLEWNEGKARHIEMRVLDGIADDSFNVYVKNPGGNWALVYSYTADPSTTENWVVHHIYSFPAGKGQGPCINMKIEPTNVGWSGFSTWGQLAVDYVEVWSR